MKKHIYSLVLAFTVVAGSVFAQGSVQGGYLTRLSDFKTTDMLNLSQYNYGFGTARSAAMGGAFGSLGADMSSMGINPAGLGMYRSSEFSFSPSITIGSMSNSPSMVADESRTQFAFNNIGIALNIYQGTGSLTSFTLGFGYNKLVDFNTRSRVALASNDLSIAEMFVQQLRGIPVSMINSSASPFDNMNIYPHEWGAVMGYKTSFIDPVNNGTDNDLYTIGGISPNATKSHYAAMDTKGSVGEYSIAGGMNFNNVFYLGFSLGIQDIFYKTTANYEEGYSNNNDVPYEKRIDYMLYDQSMKMMGSGVNFKLGAIVRPVEGLRIGLAIHTPTYVSLSREYVGSMHTQFANNENGDIESNYLLFDPKFSSPTRLMAGISYTLSDIGMISVDYERTWYNGMRLADASTDDKNFFKQQMKTDFKGSNNIRVGLEVKPTSQLALRAGYAYYGSMLQDNQAVFNAPIAKNGSSISAGLGYRFNNYLSLDLAYSFMKTNYTQYDLFYYDGKNNSGAPLTLLCGEISSKQNRHNIILSMGVRF